MSKTIEDVLNTLLYKSCYGVSNKIVLEYIKRMKIEILGIILEEVKTLKVKDINPEMNDEIDCALQRQIDLNNQAIDQVTRIITEMRN